MSQQFLHQGHGAGIVIAVGDALVQGDAQRPHLVHILGAVGQVVYLDVLLPHHDKAGIGDPVDQVVVATGQADGA